MNELQHPYCQSYIDKIYLEACLAFCNNMPKCQVCFFSCFYLLFFVSSRS